jgi:hypothetical protein
LGLAIGDIQPGQRFAKAIFGCHSDHDNMTFVRCWRATAAGFGLLMQHERK